MKLGIVLPTIAGREEIFAETWQAYRTSIPLGWTVSLYASRDHESVGAAWNAGAEQIGQGFDYLHFGIDDARPHPGWAEAAVEACLGGVLPAARILQVGGQVEAAGSMGEGNVLGDVPDGTLCRQTGIPFLSAEAWHRVGEFLPIHYYVDDDWYARAEHLGYQVKTCSGYAFTHLGEQHRGVIAAAMDHRAAYLEHVAAVTGGQP